MLVTPVQLLSSLCYVAVPDFCLVATWFIAFSPDSPLWLRLQHLHFSLHIFSFLLLAQVYHMEDPAYL